MNNNFSENLKKIRKDNNLSQEQLAEELGVSRQAISKWESCLAYPEMDKIIALCTKFNLNIDDLLYKDIREVKGEEVTKKNLNNFLDDFLRFITDTINMFSNMTFKTKIKCLFEQCIIVFILLVIFLVMGLVTSDLLLGVLEKLPNILRSIIYFVYFIFSLSISIIILLHIFKTRYLDYYQKIKDEVSNEDSDKEGLENDCKKIKKDECKQDNENKILFKKNEKKFIIRDPKDSEYRFINGFFKLIVGMIKFFTLCFSILLFIVLIVLFMGLVLSFLISKTGLVFIGLLISIISSSVIDIVFILLLLNFVFNRKNDKKKVIWSFIVSLISLGIGIGLFLVGMLSFEYVEKDKDIIKTEYVEFDMQEDFIFGYYSPDIEFIESNNNNIKIEYSINNYCNFDYNVTQNRIVHMWSSCDDPIKITKLVLKKFNDKKIVPIDNGLFDVKVYTTKENIDVLKNNYKNFIDFEMKRQNMINSYENRINELEHEIDNYIQKEIEYKDEINSLKYQLDNNY